MKKIIYGVLACIIVIGAIITFTIGLNVDIIYSKNIEINIYIGKTVNSEEIRQIAKEIFPKEKLLVQKIEMFDDMVSIRMKDKTDEELKEQVKQLNEKINEKYEIENKVEDISIVHNSKARLSNIIMPYMVPIGISMVIVFIFVGIRYRKLGTIKTIINYVLCTAIVELEYLSILAITRFPINRLVIPIGLVLYIITITSLSFKNEKKLTKMVQDENTKKNKK